VFARTTAAKGPFIGCIFTDPMVGSSASVEVARAMRIEAHGLDLHSGFNILKQRILDVVGKPSNLVLSHPPYHNIVVHIGNVWGRGPRPDDLSRCTNEDEFLEKLTIALKKSTPQHEDRRLLRRNHWAPNDLALYLGNQFPAPYRGGAFIAFHGQAGGGTCVGCHGANGEGTPVGSDLTSSKWPWGDGSLASIQQLITQGVPKPKEYRSPMPSMGGAQLSPSEISAVTAYVWALSHQRHN
jgi:hypothetical protein